MTDIICRKTMQRCQHPGMCSPHGGCRPAVEISAGHADMGKFVDWVWALKTERDQLKAEDEALRKDAERYRWLRDKQTFIWLIQDWFPGEAMLTNVDADIDAAMTKEQSQ